MPFAKCDDFRQTKAETPRIACCTFCFGPSNKRRTNGLGNIFLEMYWACDMPVSRSRLAQTCRKLAGKIFDMLHNFTNLLTIIPTCRVPIVTQSLIKSFQYSNSSFQQRMHKPAWMNLPNRDQISGALCACFMQHLPQNAWHPNDIIRQKIVIAHFNDNDFCQVLIFKIQSLCISADNKCALHKLVLSSFSWYHYDKSNSWETNDEKQEPNRDFSGCVGTRPFHEIGK